VPAVVFGNDFIPFDGEAMAEKYVQKRHHLDARIKDLIAKIETQGIPPVFNTEKCAEILEVSQEWVEIGRCHGYGPPFIKPTPKMVRYTARGLLGYLAKRASNRKLALKQRAKRKAKRIIDDADKAA
jgi:hypothetical protein